ncbi:hypothetical protein ACNF42_05920 [Cuniculiplasma sp. SKW3]
MSRSQHEWIETRMRTKRQRSRKRWMDSEITGDEDSIQNFV